jgi:hypothetical protein
MSDCVTRLFVNTQGPKNPYDLSLHLPGTTTLDTLSGMVSEVTVMIALRLRGQEATNAHGDGTSK